jgi:predicted nucleic acid-binding protein
MSLAFVDTNVLLYAYDGTAGIRNRQARQLLARLGRERDGAISIQVLQEFYVNATRKIASPITPRDARARIRLLTHWHCHSPLPRDVLAATELAERYQLSFWDAMILRSASELGCSTLWTEDLTHGQELAGVRVANPFA